MVLLNRPNDPSPYDGLILVEPSALKNENRYWTNCRRRVGFEFIDTDTSWPNSWQMAFWYRQAIQSVAIARCATFKSIAPSQTSLCNLFSNLSFTVAL